MIDVQLRAEWVENVGQRYDVLLDAELIVSRSRDPECDAARVLHARGFRGRFRTIDFTTGKPRMILDIAKAARLRIVEREGGPPVIAAYRPLSDDVRALLDAHTSHQGRVEAAAGAQGTNEADKRAGGETCAAGGAKGAPTSGRLELEDA